PAKELDRDLPAPPPDVLLVGVTGVPRIGRGPAHRDDDVATIDWPPGFSQQVGWGEGSGTRSTYSLPGQRPGNRGTVRGAGLHLDDEAVPLDFHGARQDQPDILGRQRAGQPLSDRPQRIVDRVGPEVGVVSALCPAVVRRATGPVRNGERPVALHELSGKVTRPIVEE